MVSIRLRKQNRKSSRLQKQFAEKKSKHDRKSSSPVVKHGSSKKKNISISVQKQDFDVDVPLDVILQLPKHDKRLLISIDQKEPSRFTRNSLKNLLNTNNESSNFEKSVPKPKKQIITRHTRKFSNALQKQKSSDDVQLFLNTSVKSSVFNHDEDSVDDLVKLRSVKCATSKAVFQKQPQSVENDQNSSVILTKRAKSLTVREKQISPRHTRKSVANSQQQTSGEKAQIPLTKSVKRKSMKSRKSLISPERQILAQIKMKNPDIILTPIDQITPEPLMYPDGRPRSHEMARRSLRLCEQQKSAENTEHSSMPINQISAKYCKPLMYPDRKRSHQMARRSLNLCEQSAENTESRKSLIGSERQISPQIKMKNLHITLTPIDQLAAEPLMYPDRRQTSHPMARRSLRLCEQQKSAENTEHSSTPINQISAKYCKPLMYPDRKRSHQMAGRSLRLCEQSAENIEHSSTPIKQIPPRQTRRSLRISDKKTADNIQKSLALPVKQNSQNCKSSTGRNKQLTQQAEKSLDIQHQKSDESTKRSLSLNQASSKCDKSLATPKKLTLTQRTNKSPATLCEETCSDDSLRTEFNEMPITEPEEFNSVERVSNNSSPLKNQNSSADATFFTPIKPSERVQKSSAIPSKQVSARPLRKRLTTPQKQALDSALELDSLLMPAKNKENPLTGPKKLPNVKRTRNLSVPHQKRVSTKEAQECLVTPIRPTKKAKNSSTPLQKQASKRKKTSAKQAVSQYKKHLESIPIDNLQPKKTVQRRKAKSAEIKLPGKHTLKRKRHTVAALRKADEGYEDDIYESKKFDHFKNLFITTATPGSSALFSQMSTPQMGFQVTPLIRKKTPKFKNCFSPKDYAKRRKVAEEFFYRSKMRKKKSASILKTPDKEPEKKNLHYHEALSEACKIQETIEDLVEDKSDKDDSYFSDLYSP